LILQAIVSFGLGGYIAGRVRGGIDATSGAEREMHDGLHGLAAWALAVLLGAVLAGIVGAATVNRASSSTTLANNTVAEPLLSYELDRLLRSPRRPANADISAERAEAGL
jgi:ABC-type branched-subunit amino acid transport system permease subunit